MKNAKISIVMPSYLGEYKRTAKDRDAKILRAIESVVNQTYTNWELVIVADGCKKTVNIICDYLTKCSPEIAGKIEGYSIPKSKTWAGKPRNTGIEKATGDIICYLDIDDMLAPNHLQFIADNITGFDWIWFDDMTFNGSIWSIRKCSVVHYGHCGTANIAHRKLNKALWPETSHYSYDDWSMIRTLKSFNGKYAGEGGYCVCHIPDKYDF